MTTRERTFIFNIFVILFNIIVGLLVEGFLLIALFFFFSENPNLSESVIGQVALPLILLLGLIAAMSMSVHAVSWVIDKFDLEEKLDPKVISRYQKKL